MSTSVMKKMMPFGILALLFGATHLMAHGGIIKNSACCQLGIFPDAVQSIGIGDSQTYSASLTIPIGGCQGGLLEFSSRGVSTGLTINQTPTDPFDDYEIEVHPGAPMEAEWTAVATIWDPTNPNVRLGECTKTVQVFVPDGVEERPDLLVESLDLPAGTIFAGDEVSIISRIRNSGNAATVGSFRNRLRIDGSTQGHQFCTLDAGEPCTIEWPQVFTHGLHEIEVCADDNNGEVESDESNNCATEFLEVQAQQLPDLFIESISVNPASPRVGEEATVTVWARNQGQAPSGPVEVALDLPEETLNVPCFIGACMRSFPWTPTSAGTAILQAEVDRPNVVDESNENNNKSTRSVTVNEAVPLPDLYFHTWAVSVSPANPKVGDLLTFTLEMHNNGPSIPAGSGLEMRATFGNSSETLECSEGLPSSQDCVRTFQRWADSAGVQSLTVIADPDNVIEESFENNNSRTLNFVVDGGSGVTCQGTWFLTGIGHEYDTMSPGSVVDNCFVYFAANDPTGCWQTEGSGLEVVWHRDWGAPCPTRATVTGPEEIWEFLVEIIE